MRIQKRLEFLIAALLVSMCLDLVATVLCKVHNRCETLGELSLFVVRQGGLKDEGCQLLSGFGGDPLHREHILHDRLCCLLRQFFELLVCHLAGDCG